VTHKSASKKPPAPAQSGAGSNEEQSQADMDDSAREYYASSFPDLFPDLRLKKIALAIGRGDPLDAADARRISEALLRLSDRKLPLKQRLTRIARDLDLTAPRGRFGRSRMTAGQVVDDPALRVAWAIALAEEPGTSLNAATDRALQELSRRGFDVPDARTAQRYRKMYSSQVDSFRRDLERLPFENAVLDWARSNVPGFEAMPWPSIVRAYRNRDNNST